MRTESDLDHDTASGSSESPTSNHRRRLWRGRRRRLRRRRPALLQMPARCEHRVEEQLRVLDFARSAVQRVRLARGLAGEGRGFALDGRAGRLGRKAGVCGGGALYFVFFEHGIGDGPDEASPWCVVRPMFAQDVHRVLEGVKGR